MKPATTTEPGSAATVWHALDSDEGVSRLSSNAQSGLDAAEVARRLEKYGRNRLPEGARQGPFVRFLLHFNNILVYVLLAAGFVKLLLGLWLDASIIFGVVIINALLGFIQEGKAEKALDSIRNMLSAEAKATRGGSSGMIPAEDLVPGDIVALESGDRIPADLRLIEVKNLRTEETALTGESVPADKSTDAVAANATVGDREGMAFSGTLVVSGRAAGIVVGTGAETELGRINQMLAGVSPLQTPLLRQIKQFGYAITAIILVVSALVFAWGRWVQGVPFVELFQAVVGIAVSVIPEGLPALLTVTLAIGVQRMAQRHAIVRRLPAVETLGSVSRICSDKTGTLTLMEMMVVSAVTAEANYHITGDGYASDGQVLHDGKPVGKEPLLELMGRVSMLCNDAELRQVEGVWKVEGDPDVMQRPPRAGNRPIVDRFGVWRIFFVGLALLALTLTAFFWMKSRDASDDLARTVAVNALVLGQVFYLLNSRYKLDSSLSLKAHLGNPYLPIGIGAVIVLQLLFTYAPPLQALFDTQSMPLWIWPCLLLGGLLFFLIVEAEKLVLRAMPASRATPVPA